MKLFGFDDEKRSEKLTILSDESLKEILKAIKHIAKLKNEQEAFLSIDKLFYQVVTTIAPEVEISQEVYDIDDDEYFQEERLSAMDEIKEMKDRMKQLLDDFPNNDNFDYSEIGYLREGFKDLGHFWERKLKSEFEIEIEKLNLESNKIMDEIEREYFLSMPQKTLSRTIHSISSVQSILKDLLTTEKYLKENDLYSIEHKDTIKKSKERLAWFRAQKKLDIAEVAEGGNNLKKAEKFKGEARVLLKQDWKLVETVN